MTTAYAAADAAIKHWLANWTETTTTLEGEAFVPSRSTSYARVEVRETFSEQATQNAPGLRRFLRTAEVRVWIYTPGFKGSKEGLQFGEAARAIFESKTIGELRFHGGARVRSMGAEGDHLAHLVTCPFDYQEIK